MNSILLGSFTKRVRISRTELERSYIDMFWYWSWMGNDHRSFLENTSNGMVEQ